jgi:hypothetical protein
VLFVRNRKWIKLAQYCVSVLARHYNRADRQVNNLNARLSPICYLLALLAARPIIRIR